MRDMVACFSENSVNVSNPSCSSYANTACISPNLTPSIQNSVASLYRITLSNQKQQRIKVTWCKTSTVQGLTINFGEEDPTASSFRLNTSARLFRKKKGSKVYDSGESTVEIFWDLSNAKYDSTGPEPLDGYFVLIVIDSEIGLVLGEMREEGISRKVKNGYPAAKCSLISRREHFSGNNLYSTKAQFCDTGISHEISIRCSGEFEGLKHPSLLVCIDKKTVIRVKRLHWNFRGNQTIFVDGLLVDMMWDVHDWFFNPANGVAIFMFRTRSGLDSRLWLEEKIVKKDEEIEQFSLLISATKS